VQPTATKMPADTWPTNDGGQGQDRGLRGREIAAERLERNRWAVRISSAKARTRSVHFRTRERGTDEHQRQERGWRNHVDIDDSDGMFEIAIQADRNGRSWRLASIAKKVCPRSARPVSERVEEESVVSFGPPTDTIRKEHTR